MPPRAIMLPLAAAASLNAQPGAPADPETPGAHLRSSGAPCPLSLTPQHARAARDNLNAGRYTPPAARRAGTVTLPIAAHTVRRSDGTGGISRADLEQTILDAQLRFAPGGFELCIAESRTIDSDAFYTGIDTMDEIDALRTAHRVPGMINIYFTDRLALGGSTICGISSFTFSHTQGIIVRNGCSAAAGNTSTLAHEIGHYFDLFHTHENALGLECVNGSNCATSGDQICDTPADPNLLGRVNAACEWFGTDGDPCGSGTPYEPPTANLMSYSTRACRQHFTPGQFARVAATLAALRPDLDPGLCGPACANAADVNDDGRLSPADFNAWIIAFNAGDSAADQNQDGTVTPADFNAWVSNYNAGCP